MELKKLKKLTIGRITPKGLEVLQKTFPAVTIEANIVSVNYDR